MFVADFFIINFSEIFLESDEYNTNLKYYFFFNEFPLSEPKEKIKIKLGMHFVIKILIN